MKNILLILLMLLVNTVAHAAGSDDNLGVWNNQEKDGKIELYKCGERYCGRIVWMKEPNYPAGSKEGTPGTPRLDHNNPNPVQRKTPLLGLEIAHGFFFAGGNSWKNGKVYDPKNGKTYSGKMTLVSTNQLNLRGFIGFTFIGRTTIWTR
jgi:uncharacterized protein (DUF2147 family)